jgi:hypothetical protein
VLVDTTPLIRIGPADVLAEHKLVRWPDGSTQALHQVRHAQAMDGTYLALQNPPGGAWLVFPVHPVCPPLAADLRRSHWHDWPGLVYYQLRACFGSAGELRAAVLDQQAQAAVAAMRCAA